MGLAQHIYRRGGVYWWRRRGLPDSDGREQYLYLSLKVRTPQAARVLGIRVTAEAERITSLVRAGMLNPDQQRALLALFIAEQVEQFDGIAADVILRDTREGQEIKKQARDERIIAAVNRPGFSGGIFV